MSDVKDRLRSPMVGRGAAPDAEREPEPECGMILSHGHSNPMVVGARTPTPEDRQAADGGTVGEMDDSERDALIESIDAKADQLGEFVWESLEWQLAWVMATQRLNERLLGVMDNPEDDSPAADGPSGRRTVNSIPVDSLSAARFKRLLYDSLDASTLRFFADKSGLPENIISTMLEEQARAANERK